MAFAFLAGLAAAFAAAEAHAQLDVRPPAAVERPRPAQPRPARPQRPAPQRATAVPVPQPPPDSRPAPVPVEEEPALATAPPAEPAPRERPPDAPAAPVPAAPVPAAPAPPPAAATDAPVAPLGRLEDAFRATGAPPTPSSPPEQRPSVSAPAEAALTAPAPQLIDPPFAAAPARREEGRPYSERRFPAGRAEILPLIRKHAEAARLPLDLADAVVSIESGYDPHAVGAGDAIGLMQVRLATARGLGFQGPIDDLFDPETNLRLGAAHLAGAWERSGGNLCLALIKYRATWDETQVSPFSLEYCRRALAHLVAIGSPLARGVNLPARVPGAASGQGRFNWSEHDSRMRQIEERFGGPNFGIIARDPPARP